jgi:hypothetical protein
VNAEMETIWKEVSWHNFKVWFQHLPGGTEESTRNLRKDEI